MTVTAVDGKSECVGNTTLNDPREWLNAPFTFDNIGDALLSLLQLATFEGWAEIMYAGTDANGVSRAWQHF